MTPLRSWTRERIAAVVAGSVSLLVLNTLPAVTGILARSLGLGPGALGAYASADVIGITFGTLLATPLMARGSPRHAFAIGLGVLATANLLSMSTEPTVLVALRAVGGIGTGLTLGACFVVYAREDRERNFAAYTLVQTGLATLVMAALPALARALGWRASFVALAALALPGLAMTGSLPRDAIAPAARPDASTTSRATFRLWLGILSVVFFFMGQGSLWTYLERIGAAAGLDATVIEHSLTLCAAFGFLSGGLVLWLGERVTRPGMLGFSVTINVIAALAVNAPIAWVFAMAISVFYFSLPIFVAAQFAAITRLPGATRFAVHVSTATFGGFALGPLAGARLAERFGYGAVQWLDIGLVTASGFLLLPLLLQSTPRVSDPPLL